MRKNKKKRCPKWYIKEWETGRYLAWTRNQHHRDMEFGMHWHFKNIQFSHSIEEAHGFEREKNAIKYMSRHHDLKQMLKRKEIYVTQE